MKKYDLIIIGTGAGLMVLEEALAQGYHCAIIEKNKFGGTCLTKGCIPSKMLVYPADLIRETEEATRIGLDFKSPSINWEKISKRLWKQINYSEKIEKEFSEEKNLDIYKGTAEFLDDVTIRVKNQDGNYSETITGEKIIIAAGARTFIPPITGLEVAGYLTPETFFGDKYPKKIWKSLVIIGGGAIGTEFAHIFSAYGCKVTLLEMRPRIIATEEEEISELVEKTFIDKGIDVFTNHRILSVYLEEGSKKIMIEDNHSKEQKIVVSEEIFVASGIRSNSDLLKIENTSIKTDQRGWIITNQFLETSRNNIWAIGDINGKYQFRHKANYEAEILINNLFSKEKKEVSYASVPWAIFTYPQVAHVGLTESQVKEMKVKYWTGTNYYHEVVGGIAMGYSRHGDSGFVKIIIGEEKKILGVHIVGPHAALLVQPFVYLMNSSHKCNESQLKRKVKSIEELRVICPPLGTYMPIHDSMVIHPSLNELTAWVIDKINWEKPNK
ncbi:MAG TPA: FAD-dependent oxidoreductase [Bacilli bacterium]|nr:FAD-dependent oxidoreductase [Bacilli bacterium]